MSRTQYLIDRRINAKESDDMARIVALNCEIPLGSVLDPDLWNTLYDNLLRVQLLTDVEIIAFANDVALISTTTVLFLLEEMLEVALIRVFG